MKLQGSHLFPIPPETLWPLITDPAILTAVMPGCQKLIPVAENQFQGELTIPVGPMAGSYTGNLALIVENDHIVENEGYTFTFTAQSKTGTIGGNGRLQLQSQDSNTLLTYEGEAKVGGQLASHATPLLETNGRSLIRQSLENLDQLIQSEKSPILPTPTTAQAVTEPPTSSGNILREQQTTILVITALTTITLFALFYFFTRKPSQDS